MKRGNMRVKFFATYRKISGCMECNMPAPSTLHELLYQVSDKWPGLRDKLLSPDGQNIGADAIVLVDGRDVRHLQGIDTPLSEESSVALFPRVAGG